MIATYETLDTWITYRRLIESRFDITIQRKPKERWWDILGHSVHIDDWGPDAPARGTVILVHGGGGNGRILAPLCDFAASLGWRALAPDLPGYGLTRPAPGYRGDYDDWPAVIAALADDCTGPIVLMGLSVGGMTAVFAAETARGVDGVIGTTLLDMSDPAVLVHAARWRLLGRLSLIGFRIMPRLLDRLKMPVHLVAPMRKMSRDPEMQDFFARDPLLGGLWVRLRFFRTMHAWKMEKLSLRCPLLLIHPGADDWTPTELSLAAFERIDGSKHFVELTNGSHLPLEQPAFAELQDKVRKFLLTAESNAMLGEGQST